MFLRETATVRVVLRDFRRMAVQLIAPPRMTDRVVTPLLDRRLYVVPSMNVPIYFQPLFSK